MVGALFRSVELIQDVRAVPAVVWDVLTDVEAAAATLSGVDRVEVVAGDRYEEGFRWRETRTMMGKSVTQEMTVEVASAPRRTAVTAFQDGVAYRSEFIIVPTEAGGSQVLSVFGGVLEDPSLTSRLSWRLLGGIGMRMAARTMRQDLADIAATAEARGSHPETGGTLRRLDV